MATQAGALAHGETPRGGRMQGLVALILVLTLANGIVGFDRQTVSFLAPLIVADLGLNNAQIGWTAGALSLAVALSSFFMSQYADRKGRRKLVVLWCTLAFSLLSGAAGLAMSFAVLVASRFALGLAEGPIVPVSQALIMQHSKPKWRGLNMGITQMVGAFGIAGFLGPVVATQLGAAYGWRAAMFLSILPGLLVAALIAIYVRPDARPQVRAADAPPTASPLASFGALLGIANMRVSLVIAGLVTGWLVVQSTFLALFLTQVKGLETTTAGWIIGMGGWAAFIGGLALPYLSDRIGRKPVMIGGALAAMVGPAALLLLPGDPWLLAGAMLVGWIPLGIGPLYCATVPTESVSPALAATAVGLSMGVAELFGGMAMPPVAGMAADAFGLEAPFMMCIGFALLAAIAALFLTETAPCKVGGEKGE